jgi:uncharacterized protein (TIGR01777 family)
METVLISGASGLVGRAAVRGLRARGYDVIKLVRRPTNEPDEFVWDPAGRVDYPPDKPLDYVVHLAGESVVGLWTDQKKRRIRDSRVQGTQAIAQFCVSRAQKPKALIAASAIGYYGSRGDEELTENSGPGTGFLADVASDWEAATKPAAQAGICVVNLRIGVVLAKHGGALGAMLPPFQLGLGGRVGSGKQWMSWVALEDLDNIIGFAVENQNLTGPINCVSPEPVTNAEFSKTLAYLLNRPAIITVPKLALKLLPGNMAVETLLSSERVVPERLTQAGFKFQHPDLFDALKAVLGIRLDY